MKINTRTLCKISNKLRRNPRKTIKDTGNGSIGSGAKGFRRTPEDITKQRNKDWNSSRARRDQETHKEANSYLSIDRKKKEPL